MKIKLAATALSILVLLSACNGDDTAYNNDSDPMDTISNASTNTDSNHYPHTKAVKVQNAKYKFYKIDPGTGDYTEITQEQINNLDPNVNFDIIQRSRETGREKAVTPGKEPTTTKQQPETAKQPTPAETNQTTQQKPQETAEKPAADEGSNEGISSIEQQVIDLTNAERRKNGLSDLQADVKLSNVAQTKSEDMYQKNYFSHTSPTYGSPFDMMRDFGVSYNTAGENIAQGQKSAEEVVNAWMNSEGHRANILKADFTHIGVGYNEAGNYWTQMFIGK